MAYKNEKRECLWDVCIGGRQSQRSAEDLTCLLIALGIPPDDIDYRERVGRQQWVMIIQGKGRCSFRRVG